MTDLTEFTTYVKRTVQQLIGLTCVVTAILFIGGWGNLISGWLVGNALNIMYFIMMSSRCLRALHLPPERVVLFVRGGAVFRLLMIMLAFIVILQFPSIHLGSAIAGIFTYRVIILVDFVYRYIRKRRRKEK